MSYVEDEVGEKVSQNPSNEHGNWKCHKPLNQLAFNVHLFLGLRFGSFGYRETRDILTHHDDIRTLLLGLESFFE